MLDNIQIILGKILHDNVLLFNVLQESQEWCILDILTLEVSEIFLFDKQRYEICITIGGQRLNN